MTTQNNLKEELLKQGEANGAISSTTGTESIQKIITRDQARVARMKKLTILAWVLVAISFAVPAVIETLRRIPSQDSDLMRRQVELMVPDWYIPAAIIVSQALLLIAVSFTISLYVRSRTLTMHQIQARLSNIEALLRKVSQGK